MTVCCEIFSWFVENKKYLINASSAMDAGYYDHLDESVAHIWDRNSPNQLTKRNRKFSLKKQYEKGAGSELCGRCKVWWRAIKCIPSEPIQSAQVLSLKLYECRIRTWKNRSVADIFHRMNMLLLKTLGKLQLKSNTLCLTF